MELKPKIIREFVEKATGIEDLSIKLKTKDINCKRLIAIKLCKDFCKNSNLHDIGDTFNRSHSCVHYALKSFENHKYQSFFKEYLVIYEKLHDELDKKTSVDLETIFKDVALDSYLEEIRVKYQNKLDLLIYGYIKLIEDQEKQIKILSENTKI